MPSNLVANCHQLVSYIYTDKTDQKYLLKKCKGIGFSHKREHPSMFFNASQVKENRLSNFDSLDAVPTLTSKLSLKLKVVCLSMKRKCEEASWLEMMVVDMKVRLLMINNFYY